MKVFLIIVIGVLLALTFEITYFANDQVPNWDPTWDYDLYIVCVYYIYHSHSHGTTHCLYVVNHLWPQ